MAMKSRKTNMVEIRNVFRTSSDKIIREELCLDGRLILKWILQVRCEMWTGLKGSGWGPVTGL
jgi:hypothetical protein